MATRGDAPSRDDGDSDAVGGAEQPNESPIPAPFVPGLELSERYYREVVRPILEHDFPELRYAVALVGHCSDVLGYDTPRSIDHHWGPRLQLFLTEADHPHEHAAVDAALRRELPLEFLGFPTSFSPPDEVGVRLMRRLASGPVEHMVELVTVGGYCRYFLGVEPEAPLGPLDWLTFPEQELLGLTAGRVFHDGTGELTALRRKLRYYPDDLWRYLLAVQWQRVAQQESFVGRCGEVGDEAGSAIIAADLVRDLMRLCFLMERTYAPYAKWRGTAFARLASGPALLPLLRRALAANSWREREAALGAAYVAVAERHNRLGITEPLPAALTLYYDRPFRVIDAVGASSWRSAPPSATRRCWPCRPTSAASTSSSIRRTSSPARRSVPACATSGSVDVRLLVPVFGVPSPRWHPRAGVAANRRGRPGPGRESPVSPVADERERWLPAACAIAARAFGPDEPCDVEAVPDGVSTVVYRVRRGAETFYLRVLPEVLVHRTLRGLGVRVPDVLCYEPRDSRTGRSVPRTTVIPGRPLARAGLGAATRDSSPPTQMTKLRLCPS